MGSFVIITLGLEGIVVLSLGVAALWVAARMVARVSARQAATEAALAGYLVALVCVVLFPLRSMDAVDAAYISAFINLVPFHTVIEIVQDFQGQIARQLVGNVVMFVPLGFLLPLVSMRCRRLRVTTIVALVVSVGIEFIQLAMLLTLVSSRSVDIDDVVLNVTGAVLGYLAWRIAHVVMQGGRAVTTVEEGA